MSKTTLFDEGKRAIKLQAVAIGIRAIGSAVAILGVGHVVADAFSKEAMPLGWVVAGVLGVFLATACDIANFALQGSSILLEGARIRRRLLAHAFHLGPARFTGKMSGGLVSMMTDSVERVAEYRQGYIGQLVGSVLVPFVTIVVIAIAIDPLSAVVLFVCIPLVPLAIGLFQRLFRQDSSTSRDVRAQLAEQFLEAIQGLPTLVGIGAAQRTGDRLAHAGENHRQALMRILARNQLLLFVMEAVFTLFLVCAAIVLACFRLETGAMTTAGAISLILLSIQLTTPINHVGGFFYIGMAGRAGQKAMVEFMNRQCGIDTLDHDHVSNEVVESRKVSFGYDPEEPVISAVDLVVKHGEPTVLLGPSGSGKSTLLSLIAGDLIPLSGSMSVRGLPVSFGHQDEVRSQSAVVHQQTWLFHGTLRENLAVAHPEATEEEMWAALDRVALGDWARALPKGIDTHIGERGSGVSGGQAQRISIARAILAQRELIILDEPTSQVDLESEAIINKVISDLAQERTVVLATHRPSLAHGNIYEVRDGKVEAK